MNYKKLFMDIDILANKLSNLSVIIIQIRKCIWINIVMWKFQTQKKMSGVEGRMTTAWRFYALLPQILESAVLPDKGDFSCLSGIRAAFSPFLLLPQNAGIRVI